MRVLVVEDELGADVVHDDGRKVGTTVRPRGRLWRARCGPSPPGACASGLEKLAESALDELDPRRAMPATRMPDAADASTPILAGRRRRGRAPRHDITSLRRHRVGATPHVPRLTRRSCVRDSPAQVWYHACSPTPPAHLAPTEDTMLNWLRSLSDTKQGLVVTVTLAAIVTGLFLLIDFIA